ncbi:porin [Caballeronia sp. SEWSISQ10-4 2]|uniref:porin n=1 Tax=Caballeronia sp. SEWSISQ10-4 2 TaxID=2937438 RepID=UPI002655852C|nr:porin [Caballeronia sp. SEWSISQ10-4 2]MDN7178001.1 porin [Caballeronia sp. SEWSISQ10-4 2]
MANGSWGGTYFAHPFNNDNTDNSFRVNNSVKYQSANYSGFTFGGLYGFSNQAGGFGNNRAYSAGAQYANGPLKVAAAYLQVQNGNSTTATGGAVWTQSRFQLVGGDSTLRYNNYEVNGRYALTPALALGAAYTYTDRKGMVPGDRNNDHARYHQVGLQTDYALSKCTDIYAECVV